MTRPIPPESLLTDAALLIDFDGTLVELAERPDAVRVDAALTGLLDRLARAFPDRLAIVSGRSVAQLDAFLGGFGRAVALIGSHGAERRWPGAPLDSPAPPASLAQVEARMDSFAASRPGVVVERKSLGVALHYRLAPEQEAEARNFAEVLAEAHGYRVQHGKMMSELRSGAGDKGSALLTYMDAPARAGLHPVFLGDDLTDEPAFAAAQARGGAGILVGDRHDSVARYGLPDVAAVRAWLVSAADAL